MKADTTINVLKYIAGMVLNLVIMALVGTLVFFGFMQGYDTGRDFANIMTAEGENIEIIFEIEEDSSTSEIAQRLEDEGVVPSKYLYLFELYLRGITSDYTAGTYTLNANMNNVELNRALRVRPEEAVPYHEIRIPEGWTIFDMAEYFEEREFFSAEEFLQVAEYVARDGYFDFAFLQDIPADRENPLEGYLFPDSYQIPIKPTPVAVISRMLQNFDRRFDYDLQSRAYELGLSIDDVIKIASIIERETRLADERPIVSQVIHSRLAQNMRLQMCSTVKYKMEEPPIRLLNIHLEIDTPYNTYMYWGLPAGPISNPGEAAIRAALYPADTDYLFFVLKDETTGEHHFSRNEAEHNAARALYD